MAEDTGHRESSRKPGYLLLRITLCFLFVLKASTAIITNGLSPALSWWEARDHCKNKYNGDLFIPEHRQRFNGLQLDTYYWIGAFETLEWKWTDNSPLFQYHGYKKSFGLHPSSYSELLGNSVALCYSRCFPKNYVGLSGTRCYCLYNYQASQSLSRKADQYQCPGNLAEKCGDASGMSVYKTDIKVWNTETGQCVYAYWEYNRRGNKQERFQAGSCNTNRSAVCSTKYAGDWSYRCNGINFYNRCSDRMCTTCWKYQWIYITQVCHLVKVTNDNKRNMFLSIFENTPYWIGLHRATKKMWINGSAVYNAQYLSKLNRTCLALWYRGDSWETGWVSCSEAFQGLCVNYNDPIETTTTIEGGRSRFPPTTHVVSTESTTTLVLGKTSGPLPASTANNAITTTDGQQETERILKGETKEVNNYGLYIGTGLGVLLFAVLITAVIVIMKRKEKFCFEKEHQTAVRFHPGTEDLTYGSSPPGREMAPSYMSLECVEPSVSPIAGPTQPDIVSDLYSKVDKSQRKNAEVNHSQERKEKSNVNSNKGFDDQDVYSRAGPCKNLKVDDNCYNHLNTDGDNDYDIAGLKPEIDRWDSTYNHLDSIRVDKEGNNEQDKQGNKDGENDYDIAGRKPETDRWDSTYNHLDAIRDNEESNEQEKGEDTDYYNIESTANRK